VAGKEPGTPGERPSNARVFRGPKLVHVHHFKWGRQSKGAKFVGEGWLIHNELKKGSWTGFLFCLRSCGQPHCREQVWPTYGTGSRMRRWS
jgi:hypothetical protein